MAMTFSSEGCRLASTNLTASANKISNLLNEQLTGIINNVKTVYESETAAELYATFDRIKAKFPDFINSVNSCSKYLNDVVVPTYEKLEVTASSKIG